MELTQMQQLMVEDGFPSTLFRTREQRSAWWDANPPKAMGLFDEARIKKEKLLREQLKEQARVIKLVGHSKKKKIIPIDTRGKRWDSRTNRFVDDDYPLSAITQDANTMAKTWTVSSFGEDGEQIPKGCIKIEEETSNVELFAKMGEAFHRCPEGSVHKIIVNDADGVIIREWEQGGAELPKPEKPVKAPKTEDDEKPKAAKKSAKKAAPAKKAAKGKSTNNGATKASSKKSPGTKGPGVIKAIIEQIQKPKGASVEEIMEVLVKKFPEREPKGMINTVRIQANKNCTSKEQDEKRGRVYYAK